MTLVSADPTKTNGQMPFPDNAPQAFHLLAKPTGAICNLDCEYCFFLDKELLYPGSKFRMDDKMLERYIRQLIESHQVDQVTLYVDGCQGGAARVEGSLPILFSLDETVDLGVENGTMVSPQYNAKTSRFTSEVNWVELDVDKAAQDADHLIAPEERYRVAMARQ